MATSGWVGVDLDGTLAEYGGWKGEGHIGAPVPAMLDRVKRWLEQGVEVRIFTARVSGRDEQEIAYSKASIEKWCMEHLGKALPVTCAKDYACVAIFDDRAVAIEKNTGRILGGIEP